MSNDAWQKIEKNLTPLSNHLFKLFADWGQSFAGLTPDFELIFERFEFLGSLAHFESHDKQWVAERLQKEGGLYMPVGRLGWHEENAEKLKEEIQAEPMREALLRVGFARGDRDLLALFIRNLDAHAERMSR